MPGAGLKARTGQASHLPGCSLDQSPSHGGALPTSYEVKELPSSPFLPPGQGGARGHAVRPSPPHPHQCPRLGVRGCWGKARRPGRGHGRPLPPRASCGRPIPVWAALTPCWEPSLGKPRRTGRHSSFYRPSNWGWSRRGNTKILHTQLLSARAWARENQARLRGTRLYCFKGSTPFSLLCFEQATLLCRLKPRLLDVGPGRCL